MSLTWVCNRMWEAGNYKVQDIVSRHVYVSRDVIFKEGKPHRTSASVGELIPLFDANMLTDGNPPADKPQDDPPTTPESAITNDPVDHHDRRNISVIPIEPRQSVRAPLPSQASLQPAEYKQCEELGKDQGLEWVTNQKWPNASAAIYFTDDYGNTTACLTDTKASHFIPHSYHQAMTTDPDRWMIAM